MVVLMPLSLVILSLYWNIHTSLLPRLTPPGTSLVVQWLRF